MRHAACTPPGPERDLNASASNPVSQALAAGLVARRLAARGDEHLAVALLCQALRLAPEAPLLERAEDWFTVDSVNRLGLRPLRRLALTMARLAAEMPASGGAGRLRNLRAGVRLLGRGRARYPFEGKLYVSEAFVRDKLGDAVGKALVARDALRRLPPQWAGRRVMLALVARKAEAA